ncbi:hypothetical protein IW262DRAFT_1300256 [Armillaria fumosa]|nr:hypothetical protein IW262DRAFT_1300256 [Armillaria fumosa]
MSNCGKLHNKFEVPRTESTKAALAVLAGHDKRIAESQAELHRVENGLKKSGATKHKLSGTNSPSLAGTARGAKTHRTKVGQDSPSKHCQEMPSDDEIADQPKPHSHNGKTRLPSFNNEDMRTKDAAQGRKGKEKAVVHQPTIIIMDSESMASQKSEELAKKKTATAFKDAGKTAGPVEKKKKKAKAPLVDKMGNVNCPSERKKEKTKAVDEGTKHDDSNIDDVKLPNNTTLKPSTGRQISALMSGTQLVPPTGMTNTDTTSYLMAIGAGSLMVSSHASIHALQLALLTLEDSMRHTAAMEGLLNLELQKVVRDKKVYPKAEITPISFDDELGEDGSQEEVVAPEVDDCGEGSSRGWTTSGVTSGMTEDDDEEYYDDDNESDISSLPFTTMEILDELEKTLTHFEPPSDLSPHALHGKYESIITVAKEQMAKAEDDILPLPNQLALRKKEPVLLRVPISEKQSLADCVNEIISYIHVKPLGFDGFCMNIW